MSNPGVQDLLRMRNNPDHLHWLAVGEALILLSDGLRKYAENKMKELHALIATNVGGPGVKCHCKYTLGKKPNPHGSPKTTCIWAQQLKNFHVFPRKSDIPWHQSISSQWHDPVLGYWEIAKLFMSNLGKNVATTKDPSTTDSSPLLNLLIFCNRFKIQPAALEAVRDWRNKWAHAPDHTLSENEKKDAFADIDCLMTDPELVGIKEVQDCNQAIKEIETADLSILKNNELKIIQECRHIREYQQDHELKEKIDEAIDEIRALKKPDYKLVHVIDKLGSVFLTILLFTVSPLLRNFPGMLWSLMAFFMFSQVGDSSVIMSDYGCPTAVIKSPISQFKFQEFDFSFYLAYKREGFVGRKWFFLELESIFEANQVTAGVLITGEPGSGKSALMSQLICSPYSSLLIHENTIGYHLCEYSEKGKRDGARFVRNLVDQIAARIPEYSKIVMNNEQIRTELDTRCHKDPTNCFFATIVGPLQNLKHPDGLQFIVIDALDECFESDMKTSEIMDILQSKIVRFPKWLKVILTSRNLTSITSRLPQMPITSTALYATDERNVNDIRSYVSRFISQNTEFSDRLLTAVNIGSKTDGIKIFMNEVITRAEGNFLFVKMTLQYLNDTGGKDDFHTLPTSLFALYSSFFNRQFGKDGFGPFWSLFEVLLAVYSPLQSQDVEEILKSEYKAEDIPKLIEHISCFLRFGRDGTVRLFHQSFADWLINQTPLLLINKTRGHQSIAKFLLRRMRERHVDVTFEELTELFMHILSGQASEMQETAMNLFNITEMREPHTNQSILHYLVTQPSIYVPVLDFFAHKFQTVDVLDSSNKTPAFYAASEGFVRSLQSCINHGADISSFMKGYTELDPVSVVVRNAGIEEFSLIHAAAAKGHTDVVELLITSNVSFTNTSKRYPTPLHLGAGNGHLEVVKLFYDTRFQTFDLIALHHAAARNNLAVVTFLLQRVGLRDTCLPCQSSEMSTIQEAHTYFCETALHAAVSRGLSDIVQILLAYGKESLECKHYSGKTVLMKAVERNDTEMVDMLLRLGANVTTECGRVQYFSCDMCSTYSMFEQDLLYTSYCEIDSCNSGYRAIHLSAKYGLWKVAERLASGLVDEMINLKTWEGYNAYRVALIHDQKDFLQNFNISLQKIGKYSVGSVIVELAVTYCSANVAKLFLNEPFDDEDEQVWDFLLQSVKWSPCSDYLNRKRLKRVSSRCSEAFKDDSCVYRLSKAEKIKKESERRLNIIQLLIETHRKFVFSFKLDDKMTLLHYAAAYGFEDAVKYLVELGADKLLKNQHGDTPLMIALKNSSVYDLHPSASYLHSNASYRCYTTNDGQFRSCNTTCYDEIVKYLIQSQRSTFSECDSDIEYMLEQVIIKRMPLSLYALLKIRVHSNCLFNFGTVMSLHLQEGGREVSEVLNMLEVDVSLKCEVSFSKSELHRMSFFSTPDKFGNLFQPSLNKKRFPLQRLIDRHPRGVRILDECYDAEGYLAIHRAVQGGNLAAIKWFKSIGVSTQLKTRSGLTAFDMSVFELSRHRHGCLEELLRSFFCISHKNYSSDFSSSSFSNHPILHTPSGIGLEQLMVVFKKSLEIIPSLKKNKFLLLDEQDENRNTPLHIAANNGLEDVVKYLVRLGADTNVKNKDGNTPLLTALRVSSANIIIEKLNLNQQCYTTNDGLFTLCNTTFHDEIVRYLLWLQKSNISKCDAQSAYLLNQVIAKRLPLSLYTLLKIGVDINCQKNGYVSPFLQHIRVGGQLVSEVLKIFEVDVSVKCLVPFNSSELHLVSYVSTTDDFGDFFKPSLNNKHFPVQRLIDHHPKGVRILNECYDAEGYLSIHRAAQGGNLAAIKWFKSIGVNTQLKTRSGLTALDISSRSLQSSVETDWKYRHGCFEELLRTFFDTSHKKHNSDFSSFSFLKYPILHSASRIVLDALTDLWKKALKIIPSLKKNKFLLLDQQDENGNTPLHIAADNGLEDVVKYLVRLGADTNVKNKDGDTPLLTALRVSFTNIIIKKRHVNQQCYTTNDGLFKLCKTSSYDATVRFLLWLQKSSISKCDAQSAFLLNQVISKQFTLSLYALLKIGVEVNCQENGYLSPFVQHIKVGGQLVSEVLKIFEVDVSVKCLVPFSSSELHLVSYVTTPDDLGNFFQPSLNNKRFPVQRLIDRHPRGVRILNECYDAEGYLPIHRAAQGGNLAAIKWFKSVGVNIQLKTRIGLTALDISILYLGDINYAELITPLKYKYWHGLNSDVPVTTSNYRSQVFEELLQTFFSTTPEYRSQFPCGPILEGLSPLHMAAVKGMKVLKYVHKKASEIFPSLPINCLNRHGLDPVYLAHFYDSVRDEGVIDRFSAHIHPLDEVMFDEAGVLYSLKDEIRNAQKTDQNNIDKEFAYDSVPAAQYPDREVDYIMVSNYLYHPPLDITEEELLLYEKSKDVRISDCPGYYDNFPKFEEAVSSENSEAPDSSECAKIRVRHDYYWSLCMREFKEHHFRTYHCPRIQNELQWRLTWQPKRNRQLSQFILKRLGWSDVSQVNNIDKQWPLYFLHKNHLKEYEAYEYLKILQKALEIADIRFYSKNRFVDP